MAHTVDTTILGTFVPRTLDAGEGLAAELDRIDAKETGPAPTIHPPLPLVVPSPVLAPCPSSSPSALPTSSITNHQWLLNLSVT